MISSVEAMKRAATLARQVAIQTGTAIVVIKDEKIVWRTADELVAQSSLDANKAEAV